MSRVKLSITLVFLSSLVAACGGGGGSSPDSSASLDSKVAASTDGNSATNSSGSGAGSSGTSGTSTGSGNSSSEPVTMTLDELPYQDPAPLEEMMAMDDPAYENMLMNDWPYVENILHKYVPPNVTVFPAPNLFIGVMTSCLQEHGMVACREYMSELIALNKKKQT